MNKMRKKRETDPECDGTVFKMWQMVNEILLQHIERYKFNGISEPADPVYLVSVNKSSWRLRHIFFYFFSFLPFVSLVVPICFVEIVKYTLSYSINIYFYIYMQ